jgi:hypothetical protein
MDPIQKSRINPDPQLSQQKNLGTLLVNLHIQCIGPQSRQVC